MESTEQEINLQDVIAMLKRRSRLMITIVLTVSFAGLTLAMFLPSMYKSEAVILIERQEIPVDLVRSTVTSFAEQRIQVISQTVMSSANLIRIIDQFDLYPDDRLSETREEIIEQMRSHISLEMISADVVDPKSGKPTEATIAFSLAFENESADKCQQVANDLVTSFLNANIRSRTDSATETTAFLNGEAEVLRNQISSLEAQIAEFKDKNTNNRPELEYLTREMMNRTELQLSEIDRRIHETSGHIIYLEGELARVEPILLDVRPRGANALEKLRTIEALLVSAEASYDERHPDVVRLRKQADAMRATVDPNSAHESYQEQIKLGQSKLNELLERYDPTHPDVKKAKRTVDTLQLKLDALPPITEEVPNNPAHITLAARLQSSNTQLESLEVKGRALSKKLEEYAESLMLMPDAEAELNELKRDYETAIAKYREISAKQMEARLSENLETERKGEKFTLIEPPLRPERPAKPNRPLIVLAAFVMSLFGGFGSVSLVETLDDKIRGRRELQGLLTAPPLATIPIIGLTEKRSAPSINGWIVGGAISLLITGAIAIHLAVMPLDVLWFVILRKAGL